MMREFVVFGLVAGMLATGCVRLSEIHGPDGRMWLAATCPRGAHQCLEEASDTCGERGYVVADANERDSGAFVSGGVVAVTREARLMFRCK